MFSFRIFLISEAFFLFAESPKIYTRRRLPDQAARIFRPERCARAQQGRQWLMVGRESRRCWTGSPLSVGCSNPREGQTALRRRTRLFYPGRENEAKVTLY